MSIIKVLREECIQHTSGATNKDEMLRAISELACKSPVLNSLSAEAICDALQEREKIASTGFENGIAIPHCFFPDIEDFVIGFIIEPEGIDFESIDGEPTSIFVFSIGPESDKTRHIRFLSSISHTLRIPEVRNEMLKEKDPGALRESFLRHSTIQTSDKEDDATVSIQVYIQAEDKFEPILEIFCAMEIDGMSVFEGQNADDYLNKMPLFASIFDARAKGFNRVISTVIRKSLANELIRQIDLDVGGLDKQSGVMIAVQDNLMVHGSLQV